MKSRLFVVFLFLAGCTEKCDPSSMFNRSCKEACGANGVLVTISRTDTCVCGQPRSP